MKYILAIDQGTTGSRAIVYDRRGKVINSAYEEFQQYFPKPGWVEHNALEIWQSVNHSIQKVLCRIPKDSIAAIGITNQRETTVVWDKDTGRPVYRAIVWQCRRTADRCDKIKDNKKEAAVIKQRTGLPVDAYFSASKIEWILKHVPGALAKAQKGKLLFGTTDSWVLWNLTGGAVHATDYTNASRTMVFNISQLVWDDVLLRKFNIPASMLPCVQPSSGIFGQTVRRGRLPAEIPVAGMAGDQQAALFGQACFAPGTVKNTYGTGSFILFNTGGKRIRSKYGLITTLACSATKKPIYALEGAVFVAGAAVQWLRDGLQILAKAPESEKMACSLTSNDGVYFVPALVGLGAPYWNQGARGTIVGLTRGTTRNHFVRAALEAMCYQTRDVVTAMQKDSGIKLRNLKVDGGAVANNFLCQFQADILRAKIIRPKVIETTSLGAAFLAGLAIGYWSNLSAIKQCWAAEKTFSPVMSKGQADTFYAGWQRSIKKTLA